MNQYLPFLMSHWILASAFVLVLILFIFNEWRHRASGLESVSPQQLVDFLNHADGVALDVRAAETFSNGHVLGATNIPQGEILNRVNILNKYKMKPLILISADGTNLTKVGSLLKEAGFTKLYYLHNGMQGWQSSGMPVVKKVF